MLSDEDIDHSVTLVGDPSGADLLVTFGISFSFHVPFPYGLRPALSYHFQYRFHGKGY